MKPIAENKTTVTKRSFCEAMAAIDGYRSYAWKGMGIMALAWLALAVLTVWKGYPFGMALIELVILAAVGAWLLVLLPRSRYGKAFRVMEQRCGGDLERTIRFYPDHLEVENWQGTTAFAYEAVIRVRRTKHLLVLKMQDHTGVFAEVSGFSSGSAEIVQRELERK